MLKHSKLILPILVLLSISLITAGNEEYKFPSRSEFAYLLLQESAETQGVENTNPVPDFRQSESYLAMRKGRNMAIAGTILFFSGIAVEWPLIYPWARELNEESMKIDDPDSVDMEGTLALLAASAPVGAIEIAGPLLACIGATKSTNALRLTGLTKARSTHAWKPYIIGWVLGGAATIVGFVGGLAGDMDIVDVGTGFSAAQDVAWGVATVWALIESVKNYKTATSADNNTISFIPYGSSNGGGGFALRVNF